jgi:hypothetical protein
MDAMAFGMGNCCLQITFQAYNVAEATRVYDALVPIAPIMVRIPPCVMSPCSQISWRYQPRVRLSKVTLRMWMHAGT